MDNINEYVQSIANDIKKVYDYTPEERERYEEEGEAFDLFSYFEDVLDIEYTISGNGDFLGVRLAVTLGGPNVWVDTRRGEVFGAWGTERASAWLPSEICEEINSIFEESYNCIR